MKTLLLIAALACLAPTCVPTPQPTPIPVVDASEEFDPCTLESKVCPPCQCSQDAAVDVVAVDAQPGKDAAAEAAPAPVTPCEKACANLTAHACEEGNAQCVATCLHLVATKITPFDPGCVSSAGTVAKMRLCNAPEGNPGPIRCVKGK